MALDEKLSKMHVDMWMDLLKQLPLDEKYCQPAMEGLAGLFRVLVGGGVQKPYAICKILYSDGYM